MYTLVTFGSYKQFATTWWNDCLKFDTQRSAERAGLDAMTIAGVFGYVVIKEFGETSWVVVDELTPPNASISCKGDSYSVQPAPQLTLV
jgi:hypothetical protein